jgi:hypothetical protein
MKIVSIGIGKGREIFNEGCSFRTGVFQEPIRAISVKTLPMSGREYFRGRPEAAAKTKCEM